jgi:hypothetical protein
MDDRKGVIAEERQGLNVTGTLGVLDLAAEHRQIDFAQAVTALKVTTFRMPLLLLGELLDKHRAGGLPGWRLPPVRLPLSCRLASRGFRLCGGGDCAGDIFFPERGLFERWFKDRLDGGDDAEKVRAREGEFQCAVARG